MAIWRLEPQVKDRVTEVQYWTKGSTTLERREMYATAIFECQAPARPEIDLVNENGIEVIHGTPYAWSLTYLESIPNGPWVTWVFPDDMPEEEKSSIQQLIDVGMYYVLEQQGWVHDKIEYRIAGPLSLVEVPDGTGV